jgi:outer membrane protein assembly factor BamB
MKRLGALLASLLLCLSSANATDWPQFRGPNGSATSEEKNLPTEWATDKNVAWKAQVPGYAWSSPIVVGDKVFVTTATADKQSKPSAGKGGFGGGGGGGGFGNRKPPDVTYHWMVYCLNAADGKVIWKDTAIEQKPTISIHGSNTYATETPATDGERIYAYFGMTGLFCYDLDGKQLWKADLGSYKMAAGFGTGSSPVCDGEHVYVQCDNEEKSFLVAFDKKTGKEAWRVARTEHSGWSTPLVWKNKSRTEIVCLGSPKTRSYDPATGKQLWELGGMNGQPHASPVASDEMLYVGTGGGRFTGPGGGEDMRGAKPLFAVKAGASGDITLKDNATSNEGIAWFSAQGGPSMASPILYDGYLYILEQRGGLLVCLDAKTGKQIYKERLGGRGGFTSSPWAYNGKIFCLGDDGQTSVVQAGAEFKLLGKNTVDEMCWSSPAVAGGALFLRTVDQLYCFKSKE